jgi:hypothetical protein
MARTVRSAALLGAILLVAPATAFTSTPPGDSVHDRITAAAARSLGFPEPAIEALQDAVRMPDVQETRVSQDDGKPAPVAADDYAPFHHCDRLPGTTDAAAFEAAVAYVRLERDLAWQALRAESTEHGVRALGRALHALQDCHSHSDIVDRDAATQRRFQDVLAHDATGTVPVRITGFGLDEDADAANRPAGDPFPHGDHNRDDANASADASRRLADGRTAHEAAAALATETTGMFLAAFLASLEPSERALVMAAEPEADAETMDAPLVAGLAALTLAAHARRHWAGGRR